MAGQSTPAGALKHRRGKTACDRAKPAQRLNASGACRILALSVVAGAFLFAADSSVAEENNRGAELASLCASCHRLDGRDQGIPTIVGLDEEKLLDLMDAFGSGERASQIMNVVARSLSAEDTAALAAYLAELPRGADQP
jgi:cytochrome c553